MRALESQLGSNQAGIGSHQTLVVDLANRVAEPLGNWRLQSESPQRFIFDPTFLDVLFSASWASATHVISTPVSRLEVLKRQRMRSESRQERIAAALAALNGPSALGLTISQWRDAAENPDLEEEE